MLRHSYAKKLGETVSVVSPQPLANMQLKIVNEPLALSLGINLELDDSQRFIQNLFDLNGSWSSQAVAQKYGGHQFGQWNPALGDGRGLLLGEIRDHNKQWFDLHLKGAGPTPYSRHADGRAVLRSTIREYLASEALHELGIPSSRALCLIASSDKVQREQIEPAAMMIRTAPSHIRFGHFEYYFHSHQKDLLKRLFDFTLEHHFPECADEANPPLAMLESITLKTARMVALWQSYGFVHGVMNTDNMSIHGITFDYGPYAFLTRLKSNAVFNHSDHNGRYAFARQPGIALWNLNALAYAFTPYASVDQLTTVLKMFEPEFLGALQSNQLTRLGFGQRTENTSGLVDLISDWLTLLESQNLDYTKTFRQLCFTPIEDNHPALREHFANKSTFDTWWQRYRKSRHDLNDRNAEQQMLLSNPAFIPRNHHLQAIVEQASNDNWKPFNDMVAVLRTPYSTYVDAHPLSQPPDTEDTTVLSCSS